MIQTNSQEKDRVIQQLQDEKRIQTEVLNKMATSIETTRRSVVAANAKLDSIQTPPTVEIGPYIQESLMFIRGNK